MILYCNGDSFISGEELGEYTFPNFPGNFPDISHMNSKIVIPWNEFISNLSIDKRLELAAAGRDLAFPNKIKKELNIDVINAAQAGSSMDRIIRSSITDLLNLRKTDNNITAIIGTTQMRRWEIPCNNNNFADWASLSVRYEPPNTPEIFKLLVKYQVMNDTDYHRLIRFFKNVILMQNFCSCNNIKLFWLSVLPFDDLRVEAVASTLNTFSDLNDLVQCADLKYSFDMMKLAEESDIENKYCPRGHYVEEIHKLLAEEIINELN